MPSSVSEAKAGSPAPNYVSASGVVQTVDAAAKTITIAHGAIPAVKWPAMTMTFTAPAIDLTRIKTGDRLDFELVVSGMHGEVTKIAHR
jgi:Cu(I)/Ag(I) efflux system periplasmic protein CusF